MPSKKVRVAIIGVGNCASSLVQGVEYYKNAKDNETIPGIMHARRSRDNVPRLGAVPARKSVRDGRSF